MTVRCPYCGNSQPHSDMASRSYSKLTVRGKGDFDSCLAVECEWCGKHFEFHDQEELAGILTSRVSVENPAPEHPDLCGCPWCGAPQKDAYAYVGTAFYDDEHFVEMHEPTCKACGRPYYRYEWYVVTDRVYLDDRRRLLE